MLTEKVLNVFLQVGVLGLVWTQDDLAAAIGFDFVGEVSKRRVPNDLVPPLLMLLRSLDRGLHGNGVSILSTHQTAEPDRRFTRGDSASGDERPAIAGPGGTAALVGRCEAKSLSARLLRPPEGGARTLPHDSDPAGLPKVSGPHPVKVGPARQSISVEVDAVLPRWTRDDPQAFAPIFAPLPRGD